MSDIQLYLASASPRRQELLSLLDYSFQVIPADIPEERMMGEPATDYVQRLAMQKSQAIWSRVQEQHPVLGSDTIVVFGDEVLEKPKDFADAQRILRLLSDKTHIVMTAIAISSKAGCHVELIQTDVTFRALTDAEIEAYWRTGEPVDKAGAYGIQGRGGKFVSHLSGSYSAVVGLPLLETDALLKRYCHPA